MRAVLSLAPFRAQSLPLPSPYCLLVLSLLASPSRNALTAFASTEMPLEIRNLDSEEQRHLMAAQDALR